jgi:hypothetical protein
MSARAVNDIDLLLLGLRTVLQLRRGREAPCGRARGEPTSWMRWREIAQVRDESVPLAVSLAVGLDCVVVVADHIKLACLPLRWEYASGFAVSVL